MDQITGIIKLICVLCIIVFTGSCTGENSKKQEGSETEKSQTDNNVVEQKLKVPDFNADSAYAFIASQVAFGPRIPGTPEHLQCANWLREKLSDYISDVQIQKGTVTAHDKQRFDLYNIIGSYNPGSSDRILLCAHWDTRPFADRDEGENLNRQFDGANDGGSGVGVLLEIARNLSESEPDIGVDFIFFDLEDYGKSEIEESWCLGSQYWASNPHKPGYFARYGILLDMVGASGAVFPKEGTSRYFASGIVDKVWNTASKLGYDNYFIDRESNPTTDDHLFVNRDANIPCIVIVHYDPAKGDYFPHHHRVTDNMENIDKDVLRAVGQTVLQLLFDESVNFRS